MPQLVYDGALYLVATPDRLQSVRWAVVVAIAKDVIDPGHGLDLIEQIIRCEERQPGMGAIRVGMTGLSATYETVREWWKPDDPAS